MEATNKKLADFSTDTLINELKARGNCVDVWQPQDVEHIDYNYRLDNNAAKMDALNEDDYISILINAQDGLDNNVGMNWDILKANYLDYLENNNLI